MIFNAFFLRLVVVYCIMSFFGLFRNNISKRRIKKNTTTKCTTTTSRKRGKGHKKRGGGDRCPPNSTILAPNINHNGRNTVTGRRQSKKCCNGSWVSFNGLNKGCP